MVAWEPVPTFRAFLQYGVELNGLGGLVDVRAAAVGDKPGAEYELVVPQRGIWGTASIGGRNIDKCAPPPSKDGLPPGSRLGTRRVPDGGPSPSAVPRTQTGCRAHARVRGPCSGLA